LGARHIYFRYNAASGSIVDNTIELHDLANMSVAVEMLSVGVLELEITLVVSPHYHNVYVKYISIRVSVSVSGVRFSGVCRAKAYK